MNTFEEWLFMNGWYDDDDNPLSTPEKIAEAIKQFGFDWVCGEEDTKCVDLDDIRELLTEEVIKECVEVSKILMGELLSTLPWVWKMVTDRAVRSVWACQDPDCDCGGEMVKLWPGWYESNGTPMCSGDLDMSYVCTEVRL